MFDDTTRLEVLESVGSKASAVAIIENLQANSCPKGLSGGGIADRTHEHFDVQRIAGILIPLKTTLETKSRDRTMEVYVTTVASKQASNTLNLIRSLIPDEGGLDLQHLRRFANFSDVPADVRCSFEAEISKQGDLMQGGVTTLRDLFLIVGSINAISRDALLNSLSAIVSNVVLFTAVVPLLAPRSPEQAIHWTSRYWPTVYKKSNPFGPHPSIVSRAEEEIRGDVQQWIDLADEIARQSKKKDLGEAVGAVIVKRKNGLARPVAVAGDARWHKWPRSGPGNVTAHATLRAIAMIARELRTEGQSDEPYQQISPSGLAIAEIVGGNSITINEVNTLGKELTAEVEQHKEDPAASVSRKPGASAGVEDKGSPSTAAFTNANEKPGMDTRDTGHCHEQGNAGQGPTLEIFQDKPLLEVEVQNLSQPGDGDGYLCHDLEIYCTHEPCVMCSMAIVHSRFSKVVFARRMEETGGMCADGELGHGLFWRKELNWNMLAWQWHDDSIGSHDGETPTNMHA